jgi:hypothetical protein
MAVTLVAVGGACVGERQRLDVPSITLEVFDSTVAPGDTIAGSVTAEDASGLSAVIVYACTRDSIFRRSDDALRSPRAVTLPFSLHISRASAEGDSVLIVALASDYQGFDAGTTSIAFVRGSTNTTPPDGDGLSRCLSAAGPEVGVTGITSPAP